MAKCKKHGIEMDTESDCSTCRGEGLIEDDEGGIVEYVTCWNCKGSGISPWPDCWLCLEDDDYLSNCR